MDAAGYKSVLTFQFEVINKDILEQLSKANGLHKQPAKRGF